MDGIGWKLRIVVLWLIAAEAYSAHMIMVMIDPDPMAKMMAWGEDINAAGWMFGAIYWLIPLWMSFVTVAAKGPVNRWANLVTGVVVTVLGIYHFFMCGVPVVQPVLFSEPTLHHSLLLATAAVATALITWHAWRWPTEAASNHAEP